MTGRCGCGHAKGAHREHRGACMAYSPMDGGGFCDCLEYAEALPSPDASEEKA